MYERPGGSMSIEERLDSREATTHVGKLESDGQGEERIGNIKLVYVAY